MDGGGGKGLRSNSGRPGLELIVDDGSVEVRTKLRPLRVIEEDGTGRGGAGPRALMEPEPEIVMSEPLPAHLPEEAAGPTGEVWWLIVTAAVLALGIALVLLIRF